MNGQQLNTPTLIRYLEAHIPGFSGADSSGADFGATDSGVADSGLKMAVEQFTHGQSNPTFLLKTSSGNFVLRCQPGGEIVRGAHAVDREFRVQKALADTAVPVPKMLHLCENPEIIGSPFYVMEFVAGEVFVDPKIPNVPALSRSDLYLELIRIMAELHRINVEQVGLSDFGQGSDYFARQIKLWTRQYRSAETDRFSSIEKLVKWLPANLPDDDGSVTLIHGDFRLDNIIFDTNHNAVALLDWELATLGHPFADLAYLCLFMRFPADRELYPGLNGLDRFAMGIPSEEALIDYYCRLRGIPKIAHWHFYLTLSMFRLASILQGVYKRAIVGTATSPEAMSVGRLAEPCAQLAVDLIEEYH